jgi:hypothetical protein
VSRVRLPSAAGVGLGLGCCLWLLAVPEAIAADQATGPDDPGEASIGTATADTVVPPDRQTNIRRFPGVPGPGLPWFVLSEVTAGRNLDQERGLEDNYLTVELGFMRSLSHYSAWGISASSTWSEDQRYGLHGHYRRWLGRSRHFSLDLSPGVWASGESMFDNQLDHLGVSARAGLMWEETLGIGVEYDTGERYQQASGPEWKTALRAGGYASFVAAGFLALIGILYAIAVSDPNY